MKRKLMPLFLMLFAGAMSGIIMLMLDYETKTMLSILLAVLIGFYLAGCLLKGMLDKFEAQNEKRLIENTEEPAEVEELDEEGQVNS